MKFLAPLVMLLALAACSDKDGQPISVGSNILNGGSRQDTPVAPGSSQFKHAYLLMGQSNMTRMSESSAPNFIGWPSYETAPAIAASMNDADALYIQCGVASTPIVRWVPGADLFEVCLTKIPHGLPVRGVFYYQGEADAQSIPAASGAAWAPKFVSIVQGLRSRLNNSALPVVFAQLATEARGPAVYPQWDIVKQAQASISMARVSMVLTDDSALIDGEHLDESSYRRVGQRMANEMKSMVQ